MPVVNNGYRGGQAYGWYMEWNYLLAITVDIRSFTFSDDCPVAVAGVRNRRALLHNDKVVLALL